MSRKQSILLLAVLLVVILLPYGLAFLQARDGMTFGGFLVNPIDGNTYLAKMRLGWMGEWRFRLPYTAEPGEGAYLFLFYLALGHLARISGLPLIVVFHIARVAAAVVLLFVLLAFCRRVFAERPGLLPVAAWLVVFGSGMGWLVVFLGLLPSDVWVAETYPFLSAYTNPHFPLGLALLLGALLLWLGPHLPGRLAMLAVTGLLLAVIQPFGVVVLAVILAGLLLWQWLEQRRADWLPAAAALSLGGPFLLYQYLSILNDPVLAGWNAQNLTPAPPVWDFLLSLSPALPLAVVAGVFLWRQRNERPICPAERVILVWAVSGALLVYLPFPLQRRFLLGYFVPLALLAVLGVSYLRERWGQRARGLVPWLFGLALPTNLLVIIIGLFGALGHAPELYLSAAESQQLDWLRRETPPQALVLTSPEMGLFIPAHTGRRVIYGHPFETVQAEQAQALVESVYSGALAGAALEDFLVSQGIAYVLYGEREQEIEGTPDFSTLPVSFEQGQDRIYQVTLP